MSFLSFHQSGGKDLKFLLGGKGTNLAEMSAIGLSVPPGFTITTEVCNAFHKNGRALPQGVWKSALAKLRMVEQDMGKALGDVQNPLLLSVRSGAAISMPGMMDTVLNLGLNDATAAALEKSFGERFAWDSYRRFLHMFGTVVMEIPHHFFEKAMHDMKQEVGAKEDSDLTGTHLRTLTARYKEIYKLVRS